MELINPPAGSKIKVDYELGHPRVVIPVPYKVSNMYGAAWFLLVLLVGLTFALVSLMGNIVRMSEGDPPQSGSLFVLLIFLLVFLYLVEIMLLLGLSSCITEIIRSFAGGLVPETLVLARPKMTYDSGNMGQHALQKRIRTEFNESQMKTLNLRRKKRRTELTIAYGRQKLRLAADARRPEREWLFDVLRQYYGFESAGERETAPAETNTERIVGR